MINEETIEMEETKMAESKMSAEQEAWERLHEAIFKELFPPNRKPSLRIYEMLRARTRTGYMLETRRRDH